MKITHYYLLQSVHSPLGHPTIVPPKFSFVKDVFCLLSYVPPVVHYNEVIVTYGPDAAFLQPRGQRD